MKEVYRIGRLEVYGEGRVCSQWGERILSPRQQRVLECLVESGGEVVTKEKLLGDVWPEVVVGEGTVQQTVKRLRGTLRELDPRGKYIETVPRRGYRLVVRPEVRRTEGEGQASGGWSRRGVMVGGLGLVGALGMALGVGAYRRQRAREVYERAMREWKAGRAALGLFREAVRLDEGFAPGWVGMAKCLLLMRGGANEAEAAIGKALGIDRLSGPAQTALGMLNMVHRLNWREARECFEKGVQLEAEDATGHHWYGVYQMCLRRLEGARVAMKRAEGLDGEALGVRADLCRVGYLMGERQEALRGWEELEERQYGPAGGQRFWHLAVEGRHEEAVGQWMKGSGYAEADRARMWSEFEGGGWKGFCEGVVRRLKPNGGAYEAAQFLAACGEQERAVEALRLAMGVDRGRLYELGVDVAFEGMRGNAGLREMMREIGLG